MAVSLPVTNPTTSYWQDPPSALAKHRSSDQLPKYVPFLIIGGGVTGASIAFNLLRRIHPRPSGDQPSVLLLEARDAASGATGRNGGHTKAASYRTFLQHCDAHGEAEALRIARVELANIRATHRLARDYNIECESYPRETIDVFLDEESLLAAQRAVSAIKQAADASEQADGIARYDFFSPDEARKKNYYIGSGDSVGGLRYEAGSINAYKFASGLLQHSVAMGLNLQTHTPVTSISRTPPTPSDAVVASQWTVSTARGTVRTSNLILATNGYTAHLLPRMLKAIVPLRGHVTAQRAGGNLPRTPPGLSTTYSFIYSAGYEYMIPRPHVPTCADTAGDIIIGGGLGRQSDGGAGEYYTTDDAALNEPILDFLRESTHAYFAGAWGDDDAAGRVRSAWSGIMGATADGLPFVGRVPEEEGLWMAAGFNGHGMVLCLKSAEALVHVLLGGEQDQLEWFPKSFWATKERIEEAVFEGRKDLGRVKLTRSEEECSG